MLVARDDPLDTYVFIIPTRSLARSSDRSRPRHPYVLAPHLWPPLPSCRMGEDDLELFGPATEAVLDELVGRGFMRRRAAAGSDAARARLRSGGHPRDRRRRRGGGGRHGPRARHRGCGSAPLRSIGERCTSTRESFVVRSLDLDDGVALVEAAEPDWTTVARDVTDVQDPADRRARVVG